MNRKAEHEALYGCVRIPLEIAVRSALDFASPISEYYDPGKFARIQQAAGMIGDAFNAIRDPNVPLDRAKAELRDRLPALKAIAQELDGPGTAELAKQLRAGQQRLAGALDAERQR